MSAKPRILAVLAALFLASGIFGDEAPWLRGPALQACDGLAIREIRLEGNRSSRDETVLRELSLYPGGLLQWERLQDDMRFLEGLGLFLSVDVRGILSDEGVILVLELEERSRASNEHIYPTLEFNDEMRFKAGITFHSRNLRGLREDLVIARTLGWEDSIFLRLNRPWFGAYPLEHGISYSLRELESDEVEAYRDESLAFNLMLPTDRRQPREHRLVLGGGFAWRFQREDGTDWDENLHHMLVGYSHDGRDSYFRPRSGSRIDALLVLYHPRLGSTHSLRRWIVSLSHFRSLDGAGTFAMHMELGLQDGALFHRTVWSLGGFASVRGWDPGHFDGWKGFEGEKGPQGRNRGILQFEWRRTLFGQQKIRIARWWTLDFEGEFVLFADGGLLWRQGWPLEAGVTGDRALGFGAGLRIFAPLGDVLRLELGFNPEGGYQLHAGNVLPF